MRVTGVDAGERVELAPPEHGRSRALRIIEPSPHRIDPRCDQIERCPGCPLRPIAPDRAAAHVEALHREALRRIAGVEAPWTRLPGAAVDGERAKAVARALRGDDGRLVLGMAAGGAAPVRLGECPVQTPRTRALVAAVERDLRAAGVEPWDPTTRRGALRHVIVQAIGDAARAILAHVPGATLPVEAVLADEPTVGLATDALPRRGAGLVSRPRPVRGDGFLRFELDGDHLRAGPRAWVPQAPSTVPALRRAVVEWLAPEPGDRVVEIGCGIGVLSLPIARRGATLLGIDIEREAVLDAEHNAATAGLADARFRTGEAAHALGRLLGEGARFDRAVLHAMRRPFGEAAMSRLAALGPRTVLYLGPHAPALAEDLRALTGYRVVRLGLLDQTPGAVPCLTLALLMRAGSPNSPIP
ncbi:MAG: methyltransferase domain-containing protein [bacterium]